MSLSAEDCRLGSYEKVRGGWWEKKCFQDSRHNAPRVALGVEEEKRCKRSVTNNGRSREE